MVLPVKSDRATDLASLRGEVVVYRERSHFTQKSIHRIYQDHHGLLWFGTQDGVVRFDGRGFRRYSTQDGLAANHVVAIVEDSAQHLWFGTHGGGACVLRRDRNGAEQLQVYGPDSALGATDVRDIAVRGDRMWFATNRGLVLFHDGKFVSWLSDQDCSCVSLGAELVYVGTKNGAFAFDAAGNLTAEYGKSDTLPRPDVSCIVEDPTGLWLGTAGGGLTRLVAGQPAVRYTRADGLGSDQVMCAARDPAGELWFGTWAGGVTRVKARQFGNRAVFSLVTARDGLGNDNIRAISFDTEGRAWVGTGGAGAACVETALKRRYFTSFKQVDGLAHDMVASIAQDDRDRLWFGTFGGGVSCYDAKNLARPWTNYGTKEGLGHVTVRCALQDADGRLWFGTAGGGLTRHHPRTLEWKSFTTAEGLPGNTVRAARRIGDQLWFGTDRGVATIDAKAGVGFAALGPEVGLPATTVVALAEWNSAIYVATLGDGLYRRGPGDEQFSKVEGLGVSSLLCLASTDNALFIGTHGDGLFALSKDNSTVAHWHQGDGLPHDIVYSLAVDAKGALWGGTVLGVFRFAEGRFARFDMSDGLADDECNGGAVFVDKHGRVWFGTIGGASYVLPQEVPESVAPPKVVLLRATADEQALALTDGTVIPAGHRTLRFELTCVEHTSPDKTWWRVRLSGFDDWWTPQPGEVLRYTSLPPGEYTLEAQSRAWTGHLGDVLRWRFVVPAAA